MSVLSSLKYGLFWHRVLMRLRKVGVKVNLYYLIRDNAEVAGDADAINLPSGFEIGLLKRNEVHHLVRIVKWNTPQEVTRRLRLGHVCMVLRDGKEIVGFNWADLEEINDSACPYELAKGEAYLYDAFISERYRGRGLAEKLSAARLQVLRTHNVGAFLSICDYVNTPMIKVKQRQRAQPMRLYLQITIGRRKFKNRTLKRYGPDKQVW